VAVTVEQIAKVAHEQARAFVKSQGGKPGKSWKLSGSGYKKQLVSDVTAQVLANAQGKPFVQEFLPDTPAELRVSSYVFAAVVKAYTDSGVVTL
jgi:hypothetical protein